MNRTPDTLPARLGIHAALLRDLDINPLRVRSHAQLDAILVQVEAAAEAALLRLKSNSPEAQIMAALDGFCETGDEAAAYRQLDAATRRSQMRLV